jgi:CubicO group peptidase (beta-lactamase class C family)
VWDPPEGQWSRPPAFPDGAAGQLSTADDLLAFARMLLRGGDPVLTADLVREMSRDHLTAEQREFGRVFLGGRGWGLGTSVVREGPWAGAFGWDGGLGTSFLVHPERDVAVITLTQRLFDSPQAPAVHTDLQAAALAALRCPWLVDLPRDQAMAQKLLVLHRNASHRSTGVGRTSRRGLPDADPRADHRAGRSHPAAGHLSIGAGGTRGR